MGNNKTGRGSVGKKVKKVVYQDINSSSGLVPISNSAGHRYLTSETAKKSVVGRFRITLSFGTDGKCILRFPAGKFTSGTDSWEPLAAPLFVRALLWDSVKSVAVPITFQGKRTGEVIWGWIDSDAIYMPAYPGSNVDMYIYCDAYVTTVGDVIPLNRIANPQQGEAVTNHATNILDYTTKTTRATMAGAVSNNTSYGYCPFVLGSPTGNPRVTVFYGDSRVDCHGDNTGQSANGWEQTTFYQKAALLRGGSASAIGASGSRLNLDIANSFTLMQKQFAYCKSIGATDFVCLSGANDLLDNRTSDQLLLNITTLKNEVERQGMRFWICTNPPINASTSDNYLTAANQSITAGTNATRDGHRKTSNTAIRTGAYGYCIDICTALESSEGSSKYKDAVLDTDGPYPLSVANAGTTINQFTNNNAGVVTLSYGRWRNDLAIFTGNVTGALAGVVKIISNFYYGLIGSNNRMDVSVLLTADVGDTFNRWKRYTHDGLHWRTEAAQTDVAVVVAASGCLG